MIYISMIHLMARRLEPVPHRYAFRYRLAA
jgi:hypothetical protein